MLNYNLFHLLQVSFGEEYAVKFAEIANRATVESPNRRLSLYFSNDHVEEVNELQVVFWK